MRVLLLDQIAQVGYKYTFSLANALSKAGVDVRLVIDQKQEKENCVCERINLFNTADKSVGKVAKTLNYVQSYIRIFSLLKAKKYDVIHTEWYTLSPVDFLFLSLIKKHFRIGYVATVHDILPFDQKMYDLYFHKKLYKLADSIIVQAPENVKRFAELFPECQDKVVMIHHGHLFDYAEPLNSLEAREKLEIPEEKLVFLFFGQIKKVKGVDVFLKSIVSLREKGIDSYFVIAGNVWKSDFNVCQEIISSANLDGYLKTDIRYIPDEDVKYYYSACDVCVLPYTDVYQSGVLQLAYAYHKPVVASDLKAFAQFVKEGETGFLAKAGDAEDLMKTILRAIETKEKLPQIGEMGYQFIRHTLNWDDIAHRIIDECYTTEK